jgi:hypothetical protein
VIPVDDAAERLRRLLAEPGELVGTVDLPSYTAALLRLYDVTKERDALAARLELRLAWEAWDMAKTPDERDAASARRAAAEARLGELGITDWVPR